MILAPQSAGSQCAKLILIQIYEIEAMGDNLTCPYLFYLNSFPKIPLLSGTLFFPAPFSLTNHMVSL